MATQSLLVELLVEELPPKALKKLGEAFAGVLYAQLKAQGLATDSSCLTSYASPRRLAAHVTAVAAQAEERSVTQKLMPVGVGLDGNGNATPALLRKLQALGAEATPVASLRRATEGKAEALFLDSRVPGVTLAEGLQNALTEAIAQLPIPKVMTYQLPDGWTDVKFVRPVHRLLALHGAQVVGVRALGLQAGNLTEGHRFQTTQPELAIPDADSYATHLREKGAVIASFEERRAVISEQLHSVAARVAAHEAIASFTPGAGPTNGPQEVPSHGGRDSWSGALEPMKDEGLLDEVTALVERPLVLVCEFDKQFLEVPQECLVLTMKANQKYFPLLDASGRLNNKFLVVSNIQPSDPSAVTRGNERVVRPRLADAKFFFDQDRKKTLASRVEGLGRVVYHNKLGTQGERTERVVRIATQIADQLLARQAPVAADVPDFRDAVATAARLAKADLLTDMVAEFPELQGVMGGYYARHDGLAAEVAQAIEDHYRPRFAGDALPRNGVGTVVALADKLETLVGLFGIGQLPTGDRDPFALRRHALGVVRMLVEGNLPLELDELLRDAVGVFGGTISDPTAALTEFIFERLSGSLREQGFSAREVDAVLTMRPRLGDVPRRLDAVRSFAALPEAPALAAANKRIANILKKAPAADAHVSELLLREPAEKALHQALRQVLPQALEQFGAGDYTGSLRTLSALRGPVDAFFDGVMVNAEETDLRCNRLGLLATLHGAMNRVADLSRLAA